jgi:2-alkenal reductase
VNLYKEVSPGVVSITVETDQGTALGSGFVYDTQGHIITNYHVVEGATDQEVDFPSGIKAHAKVIGTDLDSDIAVLQVSDVAAEDLHPLTLGDSSKLQVGQTLIAIGNPFGLTGTMTTGIVSAVGRTLESMRQSSAGNYYSAGDLIQTDAAINPGNSGGPLLDMTGEVVGITRAIRTNATTDTGEPTNSGIGFAVSINIVKRVVPVLISTGKYDYPYLGISSQDSLTLTEQEALGLTQSTGAYVTEIAAGGPAEKAGVLGGSQPTKIQGLNKGGDLIIAVDGHPVLVFGDLLSYLMNNKAPGDQIVLTVLRDGQKKDLTLTLVKRP